MQIAVEKTGLTRTIGAFAQAVLLICFAGTIMAQEVPQEAQRHLARAQTAMEMAKYPEDYALAVEEFESAIRLAPQWPEPHYQLGLAREKQGQYAQAVAALNRYLELAPNATNAGEVRSLIYKLEFKAEQILSVQDTVEILASFGRWKHNGACARPDIYMMITKADEDSVKALLQMLYYRGPDGVLYDFQTLKIKGPALKFSATIDQCDPKNPGPCPSIFTSEIEVVSRTRVMVKQTVYTPPNRSLRRAVTEEFSCEFVKPQ